VRTLLLATIAVFISAITSAAQQTEATNAGVSASLEKLHSEQWTDRARAYARLRIDKEILEKESVRLALMDLLGRENTLIESVLRESHEQAGVSDKYGEGYGEYYSRLLDTVSSIANWNDPRQVCLLAHRSYDPESAFASKLAVKGGVAAPCLVP
jgi:hypothetical protein